MNGLPDKIYNNPIQTTCVPDTCDRSAHRRSRYDNAHGFYCASKELL